MCSSAVLKRGLPSRVNPVLRALGTFERAVLCHAKVCHDSVISVGGVTSCIASPPGPREAIIAAQVLAMCSSCTLSDAPSTTDSGSFRLGALEMVTNFSETAWAVPNGYSITVTIKKDKNKDLRNNEIGRHNRESKVVADFEVTDNNAKKLILCGRQFVTLIH